MKVDLFWVYRQLIAEDFYFDRRISVMCLINGAHISSENMARNSIKTGVGEFTKFVVILFEEMHTRMKLNNGDGQYQL